MVTAALGTSPTVTEVPYLPGGMCAICAGVEGGNAFTVPQDRGVYNPRNQTRDSWQAQHDRFHEAFVPKSEVQAVSAVKWCDTGDHPFKAGAPGAQTLTVTENDDDGFPVSKTLDVCGLHSFSAKPAPVREVTGKLITTKGEPAPWGSEPE